MLNNLLKRGFPHLLTFFINLNYIVSNVTRRHAYCILIYYICTICNHNLNCYVQMILWLFCRFITAHYWIFNFKRWAFLQFTYSLTWPCYQGLDLLCRQDELAYRYCSLWQYGLWSFQTGVTKLERFLPQNAHKYLKDFFEVWELD